MYDKTVLAIMRDSMPYMDRFISQVASVFEHGNNHLIITEGDSVDGTKDYLADLASDGNYILNADVTIIELDTGTPKMGSISHPRRWRSLEWAWNTNLKYLQSTNYAICVESDLIWTKDVFFKMIEYLSVHKGDVVCPMLMRDTARQGHYFYDTNAFRLNGKNFQNEKPYHPDWNDAERFMRLDSGGGMIVTHGETLAKAEWKNQCVLHWPDGVRVVCDTQSEILHP